MKLIALDLDGTLFNNKSQISKENIKAIKEATAAGINVVISTGRPFGGLPFEAIKNTGIRYAITANGSAIYEIDTKKCLYENCFTRFLVVMMYSFIEGGILRSFASSRHLYGE